MYIEIQGRVSSGNVVTRRRAGWLRNPSIPDRSNISSLHSSCAVHEALFSGHGAKRSGREAGLSACRAEFEDAWK